MPDTWPLPAEDCPHGFAVGTIAAARRSLQEWPRRNERGVCLLCGVLVDLSHLRPKR